MCTNKVISYASIPQREETLSAIMSIKYTSNTEKSSLGGWVESRAGALGPTSTLGRLRKTVGSECEGPFQIINPAFSYGLSARSVIVPSTHAANQPTTTPTFPQAIIKVIRFPFKTSTHKPGSLDLETGMAERWPS